MRLKYEPSSSVSAPESVSALVCVSVRERKRGSEKVCVDVCVRDARVRAPDCLPSLLGESVRMCEYLWLCVCVSQRERASEKV